MSDDPGMSDRTRAIRERERAENQQAILQARLTNRNVTFTAQDGCEVTVTPAGHVFHNMGDWY